MRAAVLKPRDHDISGKASQHDPVSVPGGKATWRKLRTCWDVASGAAETSVPAAKAELRRLSEVSQRSSRKMMGTSLGT